MSVSSVELSAVDWTVKTKKTDDRVLGIAGEILAIIRKHTNSPADRSSVLSAVAIAKNLYCESAPSYADALESSECLSASR